MLELMRCRFSEFLSSLSVHMYSPIVPLVCDKQTYELSSRSPSVQVDDRNLELT